MARRGACTRGYATSLDDVNICPPSADLPENCHACHRRILSTPQNDFKRRSQPSYVTATSIADVIKRYERQGSASEILPIQSSIRWEYG
jgi:hypothetical protein